MSFFTAGELADFGTMANTAMPDTVALYRPDYAGSASPTLVATTIGRVVRYNGAGADLLDVTGEATYTIHLPYATDVRAGDEITVNATERYVVLTTNTGRSLNFARMAAVKRVA